MIALYGPCFRQRVVACWILQQNKLDAFDPWSNLCSVCCPLLLHWL